MDLIVAHVIGKRAVLSCSVLQCEKEDDTAYPCLFQNRNLGRIWRTVSKSSIFRGIKGRICRFITIYIKIKIIVIFQILQNSLITLFYTCCLFLVVWQAHLLKREHFKMKPKLLRLCEFPCCGGKRNKLSGPEPTVDNKPPSRRLFKVINSVHLSENLPK